MWRIAICALWDQTLFVNAYLVPSHCFWSSMPPPPLLELGSLLRAIAVFSNQGVGPSLASWSPPMT